MPYSKQQLIAWANVCAVALGQPHVSESVFESWVGKRLLPCADPHGVKRGINPNWNYPDDAKDTVKKILNLKSMGAERTSLLIIGLWVLGEPMPIKRVGEVVKCELKRYVRRQARGPNWWKYAPEDLKRQSEAERSRRISQLPPLDPDLAAAGFGLSGPAMLEICALAYWGEEHPDSISQVIMSSLLGDTGSALLGPVSALLNIAGTIGPPNESAIDGYKFLDCLRAEDWETARGLIWLVSLLLLGMQLFLDVFPKAKDTPLSRAIDKALNLWLRPEWITMSVALFAVSASHMRVKRGVS